MTTPFSSDDTLAIEFFGRLDMRPREDVLSFSLESKRAEPPRSSVAQSIDLLSAMWTHDDEADQEATDTDLGVWWFDAAPSSAATDEAKP